MRYLLLICNLFFCINSLFSQQYPVENISNIEGLGNNCIQSIYKDSRSILWVGTVSGLSKIEYHKIQNFNTDNGIAPNGCWAIAEDQNHNMWFGSYGGGITFFDGKKFTIFNEKNGLCDNSIRKLFEYKNILFVGTDNGFSTIDINTKKIQSFTNFDALSNVKVMGFFRKDNEIGIGTYLNGLWKLNQNNKLVKLDMKTSIVSCHQEKDSIYLFSGKGIKCFSIKNLFQNKTKCKLIPSTVIWDYAVTNKKECFVAEQDFSNPVGGVFKVLNNVSSI